jgi:hypothetical protein
MKNLQPLKNLLFIILIGYFVTSCSKEEINGNEDYTSISVNLSSSSELYSDVFLDIKDVQIQTGADSQNPGSWTSLGAINSGVFNFADMNNGAELVLVEDLVIPVSHIYQVKLVLGDDNAMVINNVVLAIDTPSEESKESKNVIDRALSANKSYEFTLEFELDNSIYVNGMDVTLNPKMNTEMRLYEFL